ncbi:MAG: DUF2283 domain-containing protein [Methanobrevibacter arboriphilus]|uniref:DUF2283 domain-containing protein n=1 Tax=Methanobrevibacter arboriphilus TaxID=39441 RepID=A0A843AJ51_METAZ|nr:DUF2283 domain-containing protein [Methanobrevibacter arboriphilus]MBF4469216.1 DUF2283 domain-containing protein [Methanobrevibacter arboriphilus]
MDENIMLMEYDYENDILFFNAEKNYEYEFSEILDESIVMDFNKYKAPIGLEISNASKIFKVKKFQIKHFSSGDLHICINKNSIKLKLGLSITVHEKNTPIPPMSFVGENNLNIPTFESDLAVSSV